MFLLKKDRVTKISISTYILLDSLTLCTLRMVLWYVCTPAYKSLGTSVSRFVVSTSELRVYGSGPPCALCSVGYLCLLKLVFNSGDEDGIKLMSAVESTQ